MSAFDSRILIWLNGYATASARFDHLVAWVSLQHLVKGAVVAAVLCGLWFARRTQPERALLRERLLATLAAGLVAEIVVRTYFESQGKTINHTREVINGDGSPSRRRG